jgi:hypothetical protein
MRSLPQVGSSGTGAKKMSRFAASMAQRKTSAALFVPSTLPQAPSISHLPSISPHLPTLSSSKELGSASLSVADDVSDDTIPDGAIHAENISDHSFPDRAAIHAENISKLKVEISLNCSLKKLNFFLLVFSL